MVKSLRFFTVIFGIILTSQMLFAQELISGSATLKLSGPASKEVMLQVQTMALANLKTELLYWLNEDAEITLDTNNAVQKISFIMFADSCRAAAKTESSFKGKELTLSYLLTTEQASAKLKEYNTIVDNRAIEGWNTLKAAVAGNDTRAIFTTGVRSLFFACAHLGPPIATPDGGGRDLADDIRRVVQQFFDRMNVASSGMIFAGKTGLDIQNPPSITLLIDSTPFPDVYFTGRLQNGAVLFSLPTDDKGTFSINTFKVPFVPNGTLLEATPNLAPLIGYTGYIDPTNLGIKLNNSQVQTFIFKITKPTYTLDFKASSVSTITMPPDFANAAHVKKFLEDSCYLQESKSGSTDLAITINTQVSSYSYDETEELGIKVTSQIIVNGLLLNPQRSNTQQFVFEKRYGRHLTPPYGLYFWEATGKLQEAIKTTIAGL